MTRRTSPAPFSGGRPASPRPSFRRVVPVAVAAAALALSACQTQSPIQTDVPYVAADGVPVDLGAVQLRDLVVISSGKDKAGVLSAAVSNNGGEAQRIAFSVGQGAPVYAESPAHSERRLSDESQVQLPNLPVGPGDVVTLNVQTPTAPAVVVVVPVLKASGYYASLAPTDAPTPSTTATP
ncbi:hypothetical protein [Pedococcus dokdonensis]|uniref:hypothetical protein n=1 Tax=Pedococcus dokdonensis TaxID=443156 RepID=UPI0012FD2DF3|nr:hypothetical protein [Pedococcus dokdonensis]